MQWRMLARRCPSGSMTLVGDPGQASRPGAHRVLGRRALAPARRTTPPQFVTLSVNYRTPAEVMDVAARLLAVAAPTVEPSRVGAQHRRAAALRARRRRRPRRRARGRRACASRAGTLGHGRGHRADRHCTRRSSRRSRDLGAVASAAEALDAPIAVLDATDAKGLEFDHVVVVEPSRLVTSDRAGLRLLYVTITRTTKSLVIVHSGSLPEGLTPERVERLTAPAHRCSPRFSAAVRASVRRGCCAGSAWCRP